MSVVALHEGALGVLLDVERMLVVAVGERFESLANRTVPVVSATNMEADALDVFGVPMVTVQALNGAAKGSWQQRLGFEWDVVFTVLGGGRDEAFQVADELYQIVESLTGARVNEPGCGVFGSVSFTELPAQTGRSVLNAQEIVQFNAVARMSVRP